VFNKYFDPLFYSYAASEPFFDRAHNHYLDILSTIGVLGLASYLLLIIFIYWYLFKGYKNNKIGKRELQLFSAIFTAYFVHLFFVFDDINSLIFFFAILGFLEYKINQNKIFNFFDEDSTQDIIRIPIALIFIGAIIWAGLVININIVKSSKNTLKATYFEEINDFESASKYYIDSISDSTIPKMSSTRRFLDFAVVMANNKFLMQDAKQKKLFVNNIKIIQSSLEKEVKSNKFEPRLFADLAMAHTAKYVIENQELDKDLAIAYVKQAISLSPQRPQYYNLLSESYVIFEEPELAVQAAEISFLMNQNYNQTYAYLIRAYTEIGNLDKAFSFFEESIKMGYDKKIDDPAAKLGKKFIEKGEPEKAELIYNLWLDNSPENSKVLINLTITSLILGKNDEAILYAKKAAKIDSNLKIEVDYIIKEIEQGRVEALLEQILEE